MPKPAFHRDAVRKASAPDSRGESVASRKAWRGVAREAEVAANTPGGPKRPPPSVVPVRKP